MNKLNNNNDNKLNRRDHITKLKKTAWLSSNRKLMLEKGTFLKPSGKERSELK